MSEPSKEPAFPVPDHYGMTMRDYFAAKAMQALCTNTNSNLGFEWIASKSYQLADALLAQREVSK